MCAHLAKELSLLIPNQSISAKPVAFIDSLRALEISESKLTQALEMYAKLSLHALPEIYSMVLVLRFVEECSWRDIAKELSIPHPLTAYGIYKKAILLLKERKYR